MAFDLKSEEDVKQYIENLGIEYRYGCYNDKKPDSCHLLADYFEAIKKDLERAARVYRSTCDDYGLAQSCHKYAGYLLQGRGGCRQSASSALRYYQRGCDAGYMQSCLNAGLIQLSGTDRDSAAPAAAAQHHHQQHQSTEEETGVARDVPAALRLIERSCDGDSAAGCYYLSGLHITGVTGHRPKDMAAAFTHALKACHLGNMYACSNVSQMYAKGDGVTRDEQQAAEFRQRAEEMRDQALRERRGIGFQQGVPQT